MKNYTIYFTRENGTDGQDTFSAKNIQDAKKQFGDVYRYHTYSIYKIVPAIATKDEERDAIRRIRKIVEYLGEDSYIATAFSGCFDDAEQNIESDAAFSNQSRLECARSQIADLTKTIDDLKAKVKEYEEIGAKFAQERDEAKSKALSPDDLCDCIALVDAQNYEYEQKIKEAAENIVKYAETPEAAEFKSAVGEHRYYTDSLKYGTDLKERLVSKK